MATTNSILSKYFPLENISELIRDLINRDDLEQAFELITLTDIDLSEDIHLIDQIFQIFIIKVENYLYTTNNASNSIRDASNIIVNDKQLNLLFKIISLVTGLKNRVNEYINNCLSNYIISSKNKLFGKKLSTRPLKQLLSVVETQKDPNNLHTLEDDQIILLLQLLEVIYTEEEEYNFKYSEFVNFDLCLISLLGCNIENISNYCSKLMRWRHPYIHENCCSNIEFDQLVWNFFIYIYSNDQDADWKLKNLLTFLLRSLMNPRISLKMIDFLQGETFWTNLQKSLDHTVHEYRKLSLSVLKMTIQKLTMNDSQIKKPFTTKYFFWDPNKSSQIENSWKKFVTLYEIVALDTSLNQIQAARKDILNFFNDPYIDGTWGLIFFSTGQRASMESVRKYVMYLMLDVQDRKIFSLNLPLLRSTLLPSVLLAHYFKAEYDDNDISVPHPNICKHGNIVSHLFYDILDRAPADIQPNILDTLLKLLIDFGTSFDPSRIFACSGIFKYAKNTQYPIIKSNHISLIKKLFEFECEDQVFETTIKTTLFQLLNYVDTDDVTVNQWIGCMASHLKKCECTRKHIDVYTGHYDIPIDKIKFSNSKLLVSKHMGVDPMYDALCIIYLRIEPEQYTPELLSILPLLIKEEALNNISSKLNDYQDVVKDTTFNLITSISDTNLTTEEAFMLGSEIVSNNKPCKEIKNSLDVHTLLSQLINLFSPAKHEFIVSLCLKYNIETNCTLEELQKLYSSMSDFFGKVSVSFKVKDKTYASFFKLITNDTFWKDTRNDFVEEILNLIQLTIEEGNNQYMCNLEITNLISHIYKNTEIIHLKTQTICFKVISTIWDNLCDERLVLKESELHYRIIQLLFDINNINYATQYTSSSMSDKILHYSEQIIALGYSKRRFLPLLATKLEEFMEEHGSKLTKEGSLWLSEIIVSLFVQDQMEQNIFHLKSVMGYFYDGIFQKNISDFTPLYNQVYYKPEINKFISIISTITKGNFQFQTNLINYLINNTNMLISKKRIDGPEEKERSLKWQLSLISLHTATKQQELPINQNIILNVIHSLETEASPIVRIYKEWFISYSLASINLHEETNATANLLFELMCNHDKPILAVSAEKIIFLVLKVKVQSNSMKLLNRFVTVLVSNASSNKPLVRHFSNSLILSLWPFIKDSLLSDDIKRLLRNLYNNARESQVIGQYRSGDANVWDIYKDMTLTGIFGGVIRKTTDHRPLYISSITFKDWNNTKEYIGYFKIGTDDQDVWLNTRDTHADGEKAKYTDKATNVHEEMSPLQTKSGAWETVLDIDNKKSSATVKRSKMIVVASLISQPPNLGGICRLCDVLGAELLTVNDIKIKNHPQFKKVAVTADKWMPIEQVSINNIGTFMKMKKREGYTLIGLEKTEYATPLDSEFKFPEKCVVLLGTEQRGIPGELLIDLDMCLEIKQHGVSRIMNVQTAAAIVVNSYSLQHM
ncbi:hypothetical protein RI543_003627 [Arxiozyma heterogenica]|uniref:tRNA/rRNA methyltransferase SpoU type domain-containing protein n=1 Tax=Arxiozyma heterogenica TaxID=278026 RepID=A0AAN7WMP2_9SACH|nr:hypothetical protein RI543_003627 [Kazachstania heterogenica]